MKMKKKLSTFLVVVMVVMVCSTAAFADDIGWLYESTGDGVNVRSGPEPDSPSYGYLYRGETICSRVESGDLGSVRYGFTTPSTAISKAYGYNVWGYVNQSYLKKCVAS